MAEVKQYQGNLWIYEASPAYHREVRRVLDRVRTTQVGKMLVDRIASKNKWMMIAPFHPTQRDPVNAYAFPANDSDLDASPTTYTTPWTFTVPYLGKVSIPLHGTGAGSFVQVDFHPATWLEMERRAGYIAPGAGPGEILFHEMLHGYRMQSGLLRTDLPTSNIRMDNIEELYAIIGANIYRSERGFTKIRADHQNFAEIGRGLRDDESYYEEYKPEIDRWFGEQTSLCLALAQSPAKFNPMRVAAIANGLMPKPMVSMRLP